ncbi:SGNH/GDSL hydrolase family protein [Actinoplanes sp. GCM10030250]|uniref:SGNH/GDSL hydrolase family protein n=1 Tax=Actinoplanes sp. GCM10030250 TaxID=3273376 RepID=UPI003607575E
MRLMSHLTGNGPAPLFAAGVMAAAIALSAGTQAVAGPSHQDRGAAQSSRAAQDHADDYRTADYRPKGSGSNTIRIMPLGDSLTFGKGDRTENGYRRELYAWLADSGIRADFVGSLRNGSGRDNAHEGHPGWRIDWVTRHIDEWMLKYQPQVVLLDIGTNDLLRHRAAGSPQRLAELLDRIVAADPSVRIVLAKLLVVPGPHQREFRVFNTAVARVAARYPYNVTLADMSRIPAANTVDGVHPDVLGYRQMAFQWYQGLRRVLPTGRSLPEVPNPFIADRRVRRA